CISPRGELFDAPTRGADTLPSLLHSIWSVKHELSEAERDVLGRQLTEFDEDFLDQSTGIMQSRPGFAELRYVVIYDRCAYLVAMVERMAWACEHLGLDYPYSHQLYRQELLDHYWNGHYFNADYNSTAFSAECALIPFIMRSVEDTAKLNLTLD